MRVSDIVKQIRALIPNYTNYFSDNNSVLSVIASGGVATITLENPNSSLQTGGVMVVSGVSAKTPISNYSQDGLNFVFDTSSDHDLTEGWHSTIEIGGFTDSAWNGVYDLKSADNRREFKLQSANGSPALNGNEYLLEKRIDDVNGVYSVTRVSSTEYTVNGDFLDGDYHVDGGLVSANVRCAGTVDIDRALEEYTKQKINDFWIFVEPKDGSVSKDRNTLSDATSTQTNNNDLRLRLIDGFTVYVYAPTSNQIAGVTALDICRHDLLLPIMKSLLGVQFESGLSVDTEFKTILIGHRVAGYNKAFLTYAYDFEVVADITSGDEVDDINTRAFRDIDYTQRIGGDDTTDMTALINLDDNPL